MINVKQGAGWIVVALIISTLIGCNKSVETGTQDLNSSVFIDRHTSSTIEEILTNSQIVVIGSFKEELGEINTARKANNPYEEHANIINTARLYSFSIESYLLGSGEMELTVGLRYSMAHRDDPDSLAFDPYYFQPVPGQRVVLFLVKGSPDEVWFPASQPFAFRLEDNVLNVISQELTLLEHFKNPITIDELNRMLDGMEKD